jgi:hypothetical protein
MWKRIHSNRDPRNTLYSEISKEFGTYFTIAGDAVRRLASAYPKFLFGCMVFLMALSIVLSFTIFRHPAKNTAAISKRLSPVDDGFNQIMKATGNIRASLQLKQLVDSLTAKQELSARDSIMLDSALNRLAEIQQTLK